MEHSHDNTDPPELQPFLRDDTFDDRGSAEEWVDREVARQLNIMREQSLSYRLGRSVTRGIRNALPPWTQNKEPGI